jgi:hypothetical protein
MSEIDFAWTMIYLGMFVGFLTVAIIIYGLFMGK